MFACKHKFGKLTEGYQYCLNCNKAEPVQCRHKWKETDEYQIESALTNCVHTKIKVLTCENCGELKEYRFS